MSKFKGLRNICLLVAIGLALLLVQSSLTHQVAAAGNSGTPLHVQVKMDQLRGLDADTTVSCTVQADKKAPNTSVEIQLPANVELVAGELQWQGKVKRNGTHTLSATIRFTAGGNSTLSCKALRTVDENQVWGDLADLYLNVGQNKSDLGFAPEGIPYGGTLGDGEGEPSFSAVDPNSFGAATAESLAAVPDAIPTQADESAPAAPQSPAGTVTITGRWSYYNRADALVGANQYLVELVTGAGSHLAYCYTNSSGYYSCGPVNNPGNAGVRTYLRSYTKYNPNADVLQVVYPPCGTAIGCTYSTQTGSYVFGDGTHDLGSWYVNNNANDEGAYWLKDDLDRAWKYVYFGPGIASNPPETSGSGTILWSISSTDGTYYNRGGQIHLMGQDRLSPDTAVHEYGHNVMYNIYHGFFPTTNCPSPHYIQYYSHPNCAWTEGWADFLTLPVNGDVFFTWPSGAFLNLETPTWGTANWGNGDGVEGRVAGALYDILDASNDGTDTYSDGFTNIWDTIYHQTDSNFAEYWAAWKSRGHNQANAVQSIYQNTIDYRGSTPLVFVDAAWTTNSAGTATNKFVRGQSVRYYATFRNPSSQACSSMATWDATGGANTIAHWSGAWNVPAGTSNPYITRTIPNDAPLRKYKLKVTNSCSGQTLSKKYKFKVVQGTGAPEPAGIDTGPTVE